MESSYPRVFLKVEKENGTLVLFINVNFGSIIWLICILDVVILLDHFHIQIMKEKNNMWEILTLVLLEYDKIYWPIFG